MTELGRRLANAVTLPSVCVLWSLSLRVASDFAAAMDEVWRITHGK